MIHALDAPGERKCFGGGYDGGFRGQVQRWAFVGAAGYSAWTFFGSGPLGKLVRAWVVAGSMVALGMGGWPQVLPKKEWCMGGDSTDGDPG